MFARRLQAGLAQRILNADQPRAIAGWKKVQRVCDIIMLNQLVQDKAEETAYAAQLGKQSGVSQIVTRRKNIIYQDNIWYYLVFKTLITGLLIYSILVYPWRIGFDEYPSVGDGYWITDLFVDAIFLIEIGTHFYTTYIDVEEVDDHKKIIQHYLKTSFWWELLSALPFQLINYQFIWIKLIRLTRLDQVLDVLLNTISDLPLYLKEKLQKTIGKFKRMETPGTPRQAVHPLAEAPEGDDRSFIEEEQIRPERTVPKFKTKQIFLHDRELTEPEKDRGKGIFAGLSLSTQLFIVRMIKYILFLFLSMHVIGMIALRIGFSTMDDDGEHEGKVERSITVYYWVIATFTTVGYGDKGPRISNTDEVLYAMVIELSGIILFAYLIGTISSVLATFRARAARQTQVEQDIDSWLFRLYRNNTRDSKSRAKEEFDFQHMKESLFYLTMNDFKEVLVDESSFLKQMPYGMRKRLLKHIFAPFISRFPLFFNACEEDFVLEFLTNSYARRFQAGDTIIEHDSNGNEFYLIISGRVDVILPGDLGIMTLLGRGSFFGEQFAFLEFGEASSLSYRASLKKKTTDVMTIDIKMLQQLMLEYPKTKKNLYDLFSVRRKYFRRMARLSLDPPPEIYEDAKNAFEARRSEDMNHQSEHGKQEGIGGQESLGKDQSVNPLLVPSSMNSDLTPTTTNGKSGRRRGSLLGWKSGSGEAQNEQAIPHTEVRVILQKLLQDNKYYDAEDSDEDEDAGRSSLASDLEFMTEGAKIARTMGNNAKTIESAVKRIDSFYETRICNVAALLEEMKELCREKEINITQFDYFMHRYQKVQQRLTRLGEVSASFAGSFDLKSFSFSRMGSISFTSNQKSQLSRKSTRRLSAKRKQVEEGVRTGHKS